MKFPEKQKLVVTDEQGRMYICKARLVALGYQEDVSMEAVDSPTGSREGDRILAWLAVQNGWILMSSDAIRAFLQSNKRDSEEAQIAVYPPKQAGEAEGVVWLVMKSLYGLRSAPKAWWLTIKCKLREKSFTQCRNLQCLCCEMTPAHRQK